MSRHGLCFKSERWKIEYESEQFWCRRSWTRMRRPKFYGTQLIHSLRLWSYELLGGIAPCTTSAIRRWKCCSSIRSREHDSHGYDLIESGFETGLLGQRKAVGRKLGFTSFILHPNFIIAFHEKIHYKPVNLCKLSVDQPTRCFLSMTMSIP